MFDQQPNLPSTAPTPSNLPTAGQPGVEDMFSQTDPASVQPTTYTPQQSYQPSQMMSSLPANQEMFGGRSFSWRMIIVTLIALVLLGGVGFGTWWVITNQFGTIGDDSDNSPVPTSSTSNSNITPTTLPVTATPTTTPTVATPTTPAIIDTDSDGLSDDQERQLGTDPDRADTDIDGLIDRAEIQVYKTDPLKADTDGDTYNDGTEVFNGYDPLIAGNARLNQAILPINQ